MRTLVTSSRMPFALDQIRKLGRSGHMVFASDTFLAAPGSHSKYVEEARVTASPRFETETFLADVERFVRDARIELVLPAFEEVFHLTRHRDRLAGADLFAPPFETLMRLHDKVAFARFCEELDLAVPRTIIAESPKALRAAIAEIPRYFARAAYSRGGVLLLTNTGPLAGVVDIDQCRPTADNPWLVQEFVDGTDVCSMSVVHHGEVYAHATYVHPREIEHAGGIVFESIDDPSSLAIAQRVAEASRYHGQLSLDFKRTPRGHVVIECNPRPTAGVLFMPPPMVHQALFGPAPEAPLVAPAGVRRKYSMALLRDMVLHVREAREDLKYLLSNAKEFYLEADDPVPGLWQVLSYGKVQEYRRLAGASGDKRTDLMAAYFYDVLYDGERDPARASR